MGTLDKFRNRPCVRKLLYTDCIDKYLYVEVNVFTCGVRFLVVYKDDEKYYNDLSEALNFYNQIA